MDTTLSPSQNLLENLSWFMKDREVSQEELSRRMRVLGFGWHRRAVNRILKGDRRIDVEELVALAVCLETTAAMLLRPNGPVDVVNLDQRFKVGTAATLSGAEYSQLLLQVHPRDRTADKRLVNFPSEEPAEEPIAWEDTLSWMREQIVRLAREQYLIAHPESDPQTLTEEELLMAVSQPTGGKTKKDKRDPLMQQHQRVGRSDPQTVRKGR